MKDKFYKALMLSGLFLPLVSSAQALFKTNNILTQVGIIVRVILIPLVFALALLTFFWGIVKYIWSEGSGKDEGKKIMIWGVIALFVMSSIWGLVAFIRGELNLGPNSSATIPTIVVP